MSASDKKSEEAKPHFVNARSKRIELEHPIEFEGKVYDHLVLRRVTTGEISAWVDDVRAKVPGASLKNVVDDDGSPVPNQVVESLDPDDDDVVSEIMDNFLPRRLRGLLDSSEPGSIKDSSGSPESSAPQSSG